MIYHVATERFSKIATDFLRSAGGPLKRCVRSLTYEELFFERAGPVGHYIFTDFDRLSRYERDSAARFAAALEREVPQARILNHPARALERTPLLLALHCAGVNDFTVTRLEDGARPPRFPVFIRAEDGYDGPESGLLSDPAAFDCALRDVVASGRPLRGRVAIGFAAEKGPNGRYRKYGAFNIGGTIVPQHLMQSDDWIIKRHIPAQTAGARLDEGAVNVDEELDYVRSNPHRDVLLQSFGVGHIEFGRADYGVVGGRVQIYEINTNPAFPRFDLADQRSQRRAYIKERLVAAFQALDTPLSARGRVHFAEARPRAHDVRWPRFRLPISLMRRIGDGLSVRLRPQSRR